MIYLLCPAVMASVMIAVWLVRHPAVLLSVNVVAATRRPKRPPAAPGTWPSPLGARRVGGVTGDAATTTELAVGDLTFRARVAGPEDGPTVLLLHGFPQMSRCWSGQMTALADAGYRAVAVDQRGYSPGARPDDPAAYAMAHLVEDALGFIDALGGDRVHLVGHDFGGSVAWTVAGHHPDRIRTLTIASTPHPLAFVRAYQDKLAGTSGEGGPSGKVNDQNERSGYMRAFREAPRGEIEETLLADDGAGLRQVYAGLSPAAIDGHVRDMSEPGALVAAVDWYRSMSAKVSAATPACPLPTLYVWSDEDPAIGRTAAERTADHVTGPFQFEVFGNVGHWIPELATVHFNQLLLEHLTTS